MLKQKGPLVGSFLFAYFRLKNTLFDITNTKREALDESNGSFQKKGVLLMIIVGLTGGFGCGKSSVVTELNTHSFATTVDCDTLAKKIMISSVFRSELISIIGKRATKKDGSLNTKLIANKFFKNPKIFFCHQRFQKCFFFQFL